MPRFAIWLIALFFLAVGAALPACDRSDDDDQSTGDDDNDDDNNDDDNDNNDNNNDTDDDDDNDDDNDNDDNNDDDTYEYAVKVDDMPLADVVPYLPQLAERSFVLYVNTRPGDIGTQALADVLLAAEDLALPVRLWPLLNAAGGSWAYEDNLEAFAANLFATLDYTETITGTVDTVVLNVELGHPEIDLIRQYLAEGDYLAVLQILAANRDRERFAASCARMQQIVDDLHARGYLVQATTYPFILDDHLDGDPDLQDIAEVPLDGAAWDIRGFTPYTTAYTEDLGVPIGPYFVFDYARTARELFGDDAAIAVGIVDVESLPGYTSPDQLAADVAAAKAAGVRRIDVYHLLGMVENDEFDAWADALLAEPAEPPVEAAVVLMRVAIGLADDLLDYWPER